MRDILNTCMARYSSGIFIPRNPKKYVGNKAIKFRSGWEKSFMLALDSHPMVLNWSSEPDLPIVYKNPLTGRMARYIPDFLVLWLDKNGKRRVELIEIKPAKQSILEQARSRKDKLAYLVNQAKWAAAIQFCKTQGLIFRVLNEADLFRQGKRKRR
jgi:hypothetical protein